MFTDLTLFEPKLKLFPSCLKVEIKTLKDLKALKKEGLNIIQSLNANQNRKILENKNVDIILSPEDISLEDSFHFRTSGLNQVLCKIAKRNNIYYAINFSFLLNLDIFQRIKVLGKIMQNIRLCRKYKLPIILATFASNKYELRTPNDLIAFALTLEMTPLEAKNSLMNINKLLAEKQEKDIEIVK